MNADEPLCVVVAMKMEVVVKAPVAGASSFGLGFVCTVIGLWVFLWLGVCECGC